MPGRGARVTLDVILCTYNRSALLRKAIESVLRAPVPSGLHVELFVVDNNSPDHTAAVVQSFQASATVPIHYVLETSQGLSYARNAGIRAGTGSIIAMIDDDEEIEENWFHVIAREMQNPKVDLIGGPYLPNWQAPAPHWLPPGYHAAIGAIPPKTRGWYSGGQAGMLSGGNAVVRREVFERIGMYSVRLGRTNKGLLSEEDAEFFRRALAAGFDGLHVPDLAVYHFIPVERLTRKYHRRWAFWRAVSHGVLDRESPELVAYVFGIPRYRIGRAIRSLFTMPKHFFARSGAGQAFAHELASWDLLGFVYGRFVFRLPEEQSQKTT